MSQQPITINTSFWCQLMVPVFAQYIHKDFLCGGDIGAEDPD